MIDLDLNLAIYLVKFLAITPTRAVRAVFYHEYRLFNLEKNSFVRSPYSLRVMCNNDTLDLVKCSEHTKVAENSPQPVCSYVFNPFGQF